MEKLKCHHLLYLPISYFIKDTDSIPQIPIDKEFQVTACDPKLFLYKDIQKTV